MPRFASRVRFGCDGLPGDFRGMAVEPPQAAVARGAKAPTSNPAMFSETNETAPYSFAYCLRANQEFRRQLICRTFVECHASSRSFVNAESLSVTVKPSRPHASELG